VTVAAGIRHPFPEAAGLCGYADARSQARWMPMARSSFAAGARLNRAEIRPYVADRPAMMASACSSRIRARQIVALGAMMIPDTLEFLISRLLFGASWRLDYSDSWRVKSVGVE
jgi:hypothetical protein